MKSRYRGTAAGVLLVAVLIAGIGWQLRSPTPAPDLVPSPIASPATPEPTRARDAAPRGQPDEADPAQLEALQARLAHSSLRGSEPDGELSFDALGRVQADAGLRRLFDHALSLLGEFSLDEIRLLLGHWIAQQHGDTAARESLALFDRYLALKRAEEGLAATADLQQRLQHLASLRRDFFGEQAEAMFGSEEAYTAHTLERLALLRDTQLDEHSRSAALAELEAERDPGERRAEALAQSPAMLAEHESQLQALQADPEQRFAERSALWGEDAAQRLAELDVAEAEWARRLTDFRRDHARLLRNPALSEAQRNQALDSLLASRFSEAERRRVIALINMPGSG